MMATRFTRTITKLTTKPSFATQLANLEVRVSPYGLDKYPLSSLANLQQNKSGWEITPFDELISKSLRRSLEHDIEKLGMRVYFDTKSETLKIVPKKDKTLKKFKLKQSPHMEYVDSEGFVVDDVDDDSLFNKRHKRLSKAFDMVDSSHMRKRKHHKTSANLNLRMKQIQDIASELDVSYQISQRLGRIALKNKKAMRQMLKRIATQETDDEVAFSK